MDLTATLGFGAMFASLALVGVLVIDGVTRRRAVYRSLRTARASTVDPTQIRQQQLSVPAMRRVVLPVFGAIGRGVRRFTPSGVVERLDQELAYAGSPAGWDGARVLAVKVTAMGGLVVAGAILLPLLGLDLLRLLVLLPILAFLGYYLPEWILRSRSGTRQKAIQRALPDALDLMSITVEAGLGFDAALERVSREMGGPLGEELYRVVQEMRLGKGRGEALRDLAERTTVEELKSFVLAMIQAEIFGISVAKVLHVQARELRTKRRQRAEEQAQKLPVKIVFPLILCIFPALLVILLGPAAISIYENIIAP